MTPFSCSSARGCSPPPQAAPGRASPPAGAACLSMKNNNRLLNNNDPEARRQITATITMTRITTTNHGDKHNDPESRRQITRRFTRQITRRITTTNHDDKSRRLRVCSDRFLPLLLFEYSIYKAAHAYCSGRWRFR